jgi:hypothetical protein
LLPRSLLKSGVLEHASAAKQFCEKPVIDAAKANSESGNESDGFSRLMLRQIDDRQASIFDCFRSTLILLVTKTRSAFLWHLFARDAKRLNKRKGFF